MFRFLVKINKHFEIEQKLLEHSLPSLIEISPIAQVALLQTEIFSGFKF